MATTLSQIGSLIGDCISDALCWLGDQGIGQPCTCQVQRTISANCYQMACGELMPPAGFDESQCVSIIVRSNPACGPSNYAPVTVNTWSAGTLLETGGPSAGNNGQESARPSRGATARSR